MRDLDDTTTDRLLEAILPPGTALTAGDATTILRLGWLAAEIDLREDRDELGVWSSLVRRFSAKTGSPAAVAPVSPVPEGDEERAARIGELAAQLATRAARELAYALAYLLAVADVELAPVEQTFLDQLRRALSIDEARAAALVATAAQIVTPSADDAAVPGNARA